MCFSHKITVEQALAAFESKLEIETLQAYINCIEKIIVEPENKYRFEENFGDFYISKKYFTKI